MGLVLPEYGNGSLSHAQDQTFVDNLIAQSEISADRVDSTFGGHQAFGGFYLPFEPWTPGPEGLGYLDQYVSSVSSYCNGLTDKGISLSPFISDLASDPSLTESTYTDILTQSELTVLVLQDGVGARGVDPSEFDTRVTPYMAAVKNACQTAGVEMWANVESFTSSFAPAPFDRFLAQIETAGEITSNIITFEYSHYWMREGPGGEEAEELHDDYENWLFSYR